MNNNNNKEKGNKKYIGKIKEGSFTNKQNGESFSKLSVLVDNPDSNDKDGNPNQYYKGALIWYDAATGKHYQVLQMELAGVSERDQGNGFINSIRIDLDSKYHVKILGS